MPTQSSRFASLTPAIPYHVLLSRAVAKLDPNSRQARVALYEQELAALQDAIQRVEGEYEAPSTLQAPAAQGAPESAAQGTPDEQSRSNDGRQKRRSILGRVAGRFMLAAAMLALVVTGYAYLTGEPELAWLTKWVNEKVASFELARVAPDAPSAQRPQPSAADASAPAQRAVLYVRDPDNPVGKTFVGTAFWRIHAESTARPASRIFIMLDVEIPERGLVLAMSLRRDIEQGSAMSHLIEFRFTRPNGSPLDTVSNVLGIRMKTSETAAGMQLTGSVVKVAPGIFLLGLSGAHSEAQQNVLLLKERNWLDIPIAYDNGSRSLLIVQKGAVGERAINEALASWGQ